MVSLWYICDYCDVCDIYVTCDIYLNCLCQWNAKNKKNCNFGWFAECNGHGTRQSWETLSSARTLHSAKIFFKKKQKIFAECQAREALGKKLFKKIKKMALPSARRRGTRQRVFEKKIKNVFAECPNCRHSAKAPSTEQRRWRLLFFAKRRRWPSENALPSARQLALGKEPLCR